MRSIKFMSCRTWSHNIVSRQQSSAATTATSPCGLEIPLRIERRPTDILQALSEAIPPNPNSHSYKYLDDRYFRPSSVSNRVNWALAREWGKRAAHFVHHEHCDLFPKPLDNTQVPILKNPYFPQSKEEVSEELLLCSVSSGDVELAMRIYELLEENVSTKGKLALLELLCYYNGKYTPADEKYTEYRFYVAKPKRKIYKEWSYARDIKKLFGFLTEQDPKTCAAAYNALICGMSKYGNASEALVYYEKCINEGMPVHINTYNELFKKAEYLHGAPPERPKIFNKLLSRMLKSPLQPNAATMSTCIRVIVLLYPGPECKRVVKSLLRLFKQLGVRRSLGSYYFEIFSILEAGEPIDSGALDRIFQEIASQEFEIEDSTDLDFFVGTMQILSRDLQNADYALLLDRIFHSNNNEKFIGTSSSKSTYYEELLSVVLQKKSLKEFGLLYKSLVPHMHLPRPTLIVALLEKLKEADLSIVADYLSSLSENARQLSVRLPIDAFCSLTELMLSCCRLDEHSSLREACARNSWAFCNEIAKNEKENLVVEPSVGQCILNAILLQLHAKRPHSALNMMDCLPKLNIRDNGYLDKEKIDNLLDMCLEDRFHQPAIVFLECLISSQHPAVNSYAIKLNKHLAIDGPERTALVHLVGPNILQT